jgi:hypothetical protein
MSAVPDAFLWAADCPGLAPDHRDPVTAASVQVWLSEEAAGEPVDHQGIELSGLVLRGRVAAPPDHVGLQIWAHGGHARGHARREGGPPRN